MEDIVNRLSSPIGIVDTVLAVILLAAVIFLCVKLKLNKIAVIILGVLLGIIFVCNLFQLGLASDIVLVVTVGAMFVICLSHIGTIRGAIAHMGKPETVTKKTGPNKLIDHEALYNEVYEAVAACSRQKIGALITFEKHDNLSNLTKNGTIVNAPVTHELLMTIFYPGTRLHDGAVIIKENMVYAASVYYTPTTKALSGKYGSRHRAAIGISQISDSVTVVVSEETGRVSIAQSGEIEPVSLDDFIATLADRMSQGE